MGLSIFELSFMFLEYTGNRIFELYDYVTTPPIKVTLRKKKKNSHTSWFQQFREALGFKTSKRLIIKESSHQEELAKNNKYTKGRNSMSSNSTSNKEITTIPQPNEKLKNLENELKRLRDEISKIMVTIPTPIQSDDIPNEARLSNIHSIPLPPPPSDTNVCSPVKNTRSGTNSPSSDMPKMDTPDRNNIELNNEFDESSMIEFLDLPPCDPTILESFNYNCFMIDESSVSAPPPIDMSTSSTPLPPPVLKSYQYKVTNHQDLHTGSSFIAKRAVQQPGGISLSDILSQSGNLKKSNLERSPGGTPLVRNEVTKTPVTSQDIIAQALQKKFKQIHRYSRSPESSPEYSDKRKSIDVWDDKENACEHSYNRTMVDNNNRLIQPSLY